MFTRLGQRLRENQTSHLELVGIISEKLRTRRTLANEEDIVDCVMDNLRRSVHQVGTKLNISFNSSLVAYASYRYMTHFFFEDNFKIANLLNLRCKVFLGQCILNMSLEMQV